MRLTLVVMRSSLVLSVGIVVLAVSACGASGDDEVTVSISRAPTPTTAIDRTAPTSLHTPIASIPDWFRDEDALPGSLAETIAGALAERYGVETDEVTVRGSMYTQWPNTGLGCPKPDEQVLQVLTDGYLAFFDVAGQTVRVHAALNGAWRVCETPTPDTLPTK